MRRTPPTAQGDSQSESAPEFSTLAELEGKRVGMGAGNVFDQLISKKDPKVNDFVYFSSLTDMVAALKSGKVDAFAGDEPSARLLVARNAGIVLMPETVAHNELGFCFAKNKDPDLVRRMNEVIDLRRRVRPGRRPLQRQRRRHRRPRVQRDAGVQRPADGR